MKKERRLNSEVPEEISEQSETAQLDVVNSAEVENLRDDTWGAQAATMSVDMSMGPTKPSRLNKKRKQLYPPELEPYKLQLEEWVENHRSLMGYFMDRNDQDFEIIYGDWFWYKPGRKNQICMGVLAFKQALDLFKDELAEGMLSLDQIMFALLHELAHMKTTREGDRAGLNFILEHFKKYLPSKKIESADQPGKYVALMGTYFQFYNILEDCIVNRMVLNTPWYADAKLQQSIKGLYVGPFFELYRLAGPKGGTHQEMMEVVPGKPPKLVIKKVKPGTGNLNALSAADYQKGFDQKDLYEPVEKGQPKTKNLAGNFLTYFIKSQMGVMPAAGFYDGREFSESDGPKYKVDLEIAACFREPIAKLYERLLKEVMKNNMGDLIKKKRYLDFMGQPTKAKTYQITGGKVVEADPEIYYNVISPNAKDSVARGDFFLALNIFKQNISRLSIPGIEKMTLPELFAEFKRLKTGQTSSNTIPFSHTFVERTHIIRKVIEPIFSLLCLLDDSFDLKLPDQTMEHGGEAGEESDEEGDDEEGDELDPNTIFTEGREVEVDDPGNPNHGRRGIISKVVRSGEEVISVEIDYFEELEAAKMATVINGREVELTGEKEEFPDFLKKLIVISKNSKAGDSQDKNPKKVKTKALEKDDQDDQDQENDQEGGQGGADKGQTADLPKEMKDFAEQVREALEEQEKDQNKKNLEETMAGLDYRKKRDEQTEMENLKKALKKNKGKKVPKDIGVPVKNQQRLTNQEIAASIKEMYELERMLRPYMDVMAKEWLTVVENVAAEVHVFKDRFYREGKVNIKRMQKYFPEIEYGQEIETRLVKEKIVERLILDLKPKMLRLHILIDNSGSMDSLLPSVKMALMMLYGSMSSLRNLFVRQMQETLNIGASEAEEKFGLMTDVRISLFGSSSRTIKPFDFEDLSFLEPGRFAEKPAPTDLEIEKVEMLKTFSLINASEGTDDSDFWPALLREYAGNADLKKLLRDNALTDVLIQVSDGEIPNSAEEVAEIVEELKDDFHLKIGGFAIGDDYRSAMVALGKRHGADNVISANTPEEIVSNLASFLTNVVKDQIEKPYIEAIKSNSSLSAEEEDGE